MLFLFVGIMSEQIALFGTSADPPTIGHQAIVCWLGQHYDRVLVWAVDNPFKLDQTPLRHRQQMLKTLLDSLSPQLMNVNWMPELSHPRSLFSVNQVKALWPDAALTLVVGSDILASLTEWYAIDQLMQLVSFLVIQRPGSPVDWGQVEAFQAQGGRVEIADFCGPEVSSSDFRSQGRDDVLPEAVLDYLITHGLYRTEEIHV